MGDSQPQRIEERLVAEALLIGGLLVGVLIQVLLLPAPLGFPPLFLLILVVCRTLLGVSMAPMVGEGEVVTALRWAFYGGLALDLTTHTLLGSHVLGLLLAVVSTVAIAGHKRNINGPLFPLLTVLFGSLVYEFVLGLIYHCTVAPLSWQPYFSTLILPSVLQTLIPTLPIFTLFQWLAQQRGPKQR